jgi:hypothetical protein
MNQNCQNPLCRNPGKTEVSISIDTYGDQLRTLCACCEESYRFGVRHGKMFLQQMSLWTVAVADSGIVAYVQVYLDRMSALKSLANYLKTNHDYTGDATMESIFQWLRMHDEHLGVEIICQDGIVTKPVKDHVEQFIKDGGFIVVGKNTEDPNPELPFEAWAYNGPLDFQSAQSVTFGLGADYREAIEALNIQLSGCSQKP